MDGAISKMSRSSEGRPAGVQNPSARLTRREHEVLVRLSEGLSTREIADALFISEVTVRNHVARLLVKLRVHSRLAAVTLGLRNGLLVRRSRPR
jgi:DNA-binding CsgD family transcriptional regulator